MSARDVDEAVAVAATYAAAPPQPDRRPFLRRAFLCSLADVVDVADPELASALRDLAGRLEPSVS